MAAPEVVNFFQNVPSNPGASATGSTAGLQCGFGVTNSFVPQSSGVALIIMTGTYSQSVANAALNMFGINMGIGVAPAAFASAVGGGVGQQFQIATTAGTAGLAQWFTITAIVTGLAIGVGYWIDMYLFSNGFGTLTPGSITITALEL